MFEIGRRRRGWGSLGQAVGSKLKSPHAACEIANVDIFALWAQLSQGRLQAKEIILVQPTGSTTTQDVLGELLRILGADKLLVIGRADVDECLNRRGAIGGVERRVVDGVAVDLADIEILLDLRDMVGVNPISYAPYLVRGRVMVIRELFPVGAFNERDHPPGGFWRSPMILAGAEFESASRASLAMAGSLLRRASLMSTYLAYILGELLHCHTEKCEKKKGQRSQGVDHWIFAS
jgi:hypothetical protein